MTLTKAKNATRRAFGGRLLELGEVDSEFVVFESDLGKSSMSNLFGDKYPDRYFNLGIAELNTMASAAGMAASGRTVFVAGYSVFLTMRALEAVRSFIAYPKLNVKLYASHGGLTAAIDGVTHQGSEDIAFMSVIPNMKVLVPTDSVAARAACDLALADARAQSLFDSCVILSMEIYEPGENIRHWRLKIAAQGNRHHARQLWRHYISGFAGSGFACGKRNPGADVLDLYSVKAWWTLPPCSNRYARLGLCWSRRTIKSATGLVMSWQRCS